MPRIGRPINEVMRDRIRALLQAGKTQAEIARILHKTPATISYHMRRLGVEAKKYLVPNPVRRSGKRECLVCHRLKRFAGAVCRNCRGKKPTPYS